MIDVTRQELQNFLDITRNKICERTVTKTAHQLSINQLRDRILGQLQSLNQVNQQLIKQSLLMADQSLHRATASEVRLNALEQEVRALRGAIERLLQYQQFAYNAQAAVGSPSAKAPTQYRYANAQ